MITEDNNLKTINDHEYIVGYFPAMYNYSLFLKTSAILGDSLPNLSELFLSEDKNFRDIGEAVKGLVQSLYVNDKDGKMILEILSQTQRDGVPINKDSFNKFYTGNMGEMMEALVFSYKVHFGHFLPKSLLSGFQTGLNDLIKKPTEN